MKFLFTLLFLSVYFISFAQRGSIEGLVADGETNESLEYASVAIFSEADSGLVTGVITNHLGEFKIENLPQGDYYLKIQFIGYESREISDLSLKTGGSLNLGTIRMEAARQMLNEVNVTGNRINASNRLEKQTYRAEQFESAKGGNAVDVLRNMPSVAVNGQGEITVRGATGFLVLINGKPVLTDAQTALGQLPANMIENVELITSPSAKYDPDGKAGIINITTKKGAADGTGLIVNGQYGFPSTTDYGNKRVSQRHGADVMFNYQKEKWDISVGGNYTRNDLNGFRVGDVFIENVTNNTITYFPSKGERSFNRYNYALRAAVSFTPGQHQVFSVGIFSGKRYQERDADIFYTNSQVALDTGEKIYDFNYYNANKQIKQGTFTLGNFDYTYRFSGESSVTASFLYEFDDLHGNTFNRNLTEPGGVSLQYVENPYQKPIEGYRVKLDYNTRLGDGTFESGYQFRNDSQDGVFDYLITPEVTDQEDLERFRGTAFSKNQIHSVYGQYAETRDKLQYIFGLRYEYSKRTVKLSFDPIPHLQNLSNLFPSASFLYSVSDKLKLKAGYSRRIQRVTNNQLNPIPEREHSETLEVGDPDLLPEFVNLGELGLTKSFGNGNSAFLTAYYQSGKNPMQRVNSIYADTILNRVYTNVEKSESVGFETGADLHPAKWWDFYLGANIFNQLYKGDLRIFNEPVLQVNNSGWVYSFNINTSFNFSSTLTLNANVNYLSQRPTAQGQDSRYLIPNMALKKNLLDNRLTATIQWQNIDLGTEQSHRQRITTWGEHFYTTTNYIYETDFVVLNVTYNLNWQNGKLKLPASEFGEKEF